MNRSDCRHSPRFRAIALLATGLVLIAAGCTRGESAAAGSQKLFVTVPQRRQLLIYSSSAYDDAKPTQVITETAPDLPVDVAVDGRQEAFVANANGTIRVFRAPPNGRYQIFKNYAGSNTQLAHPTAIAVNLAGSFYVADLGDGHGRVEWFSGGANGNLVPDRVIKGEGTGIHDPRGVAIDGSGRLYVSDRESNQVLVFGSDIDGDATPIARLSGLHSPGHVVVDDVLNVYVANDGDNSITIFESTGPESWAKSAVITSKLLGPPTGLTIDASGEIAAGSLSGILFFAPNAQGDSAPVRTLTGRAPRDPGGIRIH